MNTSQFFNLDQDHLNFGWGVIDHKPWHYKRCTTCDSIYANRNECVNQFCNTWQCIYLSFRKPDVLSITSTDYDARDTIYMQVLRHRKMREEFMKEVLLREAVHSVPTVNDNDTDTSEPLLKRRRINHQPPTLDMALINNNINIDMPISPPKLQRSNTVFTWDELDFHNSPPACL